MDNANFKINFQDFVEVDPDSEYVIMAQGKQYKKKKDHDKAIEKFKSRLSEGFIYFSAPQLKHFNCTQDETHKASSYLFDNAENLIEVQDEPIIGTQIVVQKKQRKNLVCLDSIKHLININPNIYKIDHKSDKQVDDPHLDKIYTLIETEKLKQKKKKIKVIKIEQ